MSDLSFRAMRVEQDDQGHFIRRITSQSVADLPDGDVLIKVDYSSLNYKDALSASGNRGVTRNYPHTPGIDAAGSVVQSTDARFNTDDQVLVTGYDLGMNTAGGFGRYIRVPADWVVHLPEHLSLQQSMVYGTAGFTAGLSIFKLQQAGMTPDRGPVLVTGASGGVGSLAVALLGSIGYHVIAASGKADAADFLTSLGADEVVGRDQISDTSGKPLLGQRWTGVIDTVGGPVLSCVLRSAKTDAVVTCCGNVGGADLPITVYPFILRGVSLMGVDSATCPMPVRLQVWENMAGDWRIDNFDKISETVSLDQLEPEIERILKSGQIGRKIVSHLL